MKILRSHYITHSWKNCLNSSYVFLDPTKYGWQRVNNFLDPLWYKGSNLPTNDEYYEHINSKDIETTESEDTDSSSDSEYESDNEYPLSDVHSSSSEDEL